MSVDFWAGYISGAVGILIGNPLDLLKVRLQSSSSTAISTTHPSSYASQFPSASSLIRGATAPILGYGALNALLFMTYNRTTTFLTPGYDPTASHNSALPTLSTVFIAGAIGGLATFIVSTPTELIKCRAQLSQTPISSISLVRSVVKTEGLRGLYYGGTVTALRDGIGYGFYFWSYELSTRLLAAKVGADEGKGIEAARVLLCGGLAGVVTWASVFPLDVVKTRVQTQLGGTLETEPLLGSARAGHSGPESRIGALEMAKRIYTVEGKAAFFRGFGVCSLRAFVVNAAQWAVYEWIMKELGAHNDVSRQRKGDVDII